MFEKSDLYFIKKQTEVCNYKCGIKVIKERK